MGKWLDAAAKKKAEIDKKIKDKDDLIAAKDAEIAKLKKPK